MTGGPGGLVAGVIFAAAAAQSAFALTRVGAARAGAFLVTREADATHLVMNSLMALMVTPLYTARLRLPACALLGATALALLLLLIGRGRRPGETGRLSLASRVLGTGYHLGMLAAMIYATVVMGPMAAMAPLAAMAPPPWRAITAAHALAAFFLLDAAAGVVAVSFFPAALIESETSRRAPAPSPASGAATASAAEIATLRIGLLPHLIMDLGMIFMLVQL